MINKDPLVVNDDVVSNNKATLNINLTRSQDYVQYSRKLPMGQLQAFCIPKRQEVLQWVSSQDHVSQEFVADFVG